MPVLELARSYLHAAIKEMMAFTSIHTVKGVCMFGAVGCANRRICADAALMHHSVCKVPEAGEVRRTSL
jgi:hypothetical protein